MLSLNFLIFHSRKLENNKKKNKSKFRGEKHKQRKAECEFWPRWKMTQAGKYSHPHFYSLKVRSCYFFSLLHRVQHEVTLPSLEIPWHVPGICKQCCVCRVNRGRDRGWVRATCVQSHWKAAPATFGKGGQAPTTLTGHPGTPGMSWIHQKFRSVFPRQPKYYFFQLPQGKKKGGIRGEKKKEPSEEILRK